MGFSETHRQEFAVENNISLIHFFYFVLFLIIFKRLVCLTSQHFKAVMNIYNILQIAFPVKERVKSQPLRHMTNLYIFIVVVALG